MNQFSFLDTEFFRLPSSLPNPFATSADNKNHVLCEQVRKNPTWLLESLCFFLQNPYLEYAKNLLFLIYHRNEIDSSIAEAIRQWILKILIENPTIDSLEMGLTLLGRIGKTQDEITVKLFLDHNENSVFRSACWAIFQLDGDLIPQAWLNYLSQDTPVKNRFWLTNQIANLLNIRYWTGFELPDKVKQKLFRKFRSYWLKALTDSHLEIKMQALLMAKSWIDEESLPSILDSLSISTLLIAWCDSESYFDHFNLIFETSESSGRPFKELAYRALTQEFHSPNILKHLIEFLKDDNWWSGISCWLKQPYLLKHLSTYYLPWIDASDIRLLSSHPDPEVRHAAFDLLNQIFEYQNSEERIPFADWLDLFEMASTQLKIKIIQTMSLWELEATLSTCENWLSHPEPSVVATSLRILAQHKQKGILEKAFAFLKDTHEEIRSGALDALGSLGDISAIPVLKSYLRQNICYEAAHALAQLGDVSMAEEIFYSWLKLSHEPTYDGWSSEATALGELLTPDWIPKLMAMLSNCEQDGSERTEELVGLLINLLEKTDVEWVLTELEPEKINQLQKSNGYDWLLNELANSFGRLQVSKSLTLDHVLKRLDWLYSDNHRRFILEATKQNPPREMFPYILDLLKTGYSSGIVLSMLWQLSAKDDLTELNHILENRYLKNDVLWLQKLIQYLET